ncbi:uncharacterized protein MONOS_12071 [Monocercomonoides exilis]|uniref:uncharacterized protein n=1 Tax=Monocercomonoides exilis TaxID=2049356 RepID=UPI0035594484|nr:hypothetical protein MONOS_12071 [Monocercomonoides exilis]
MKSSCDNELHCRKKEMPLNEKFSKLFDGLEECDEEEQMQKIREMNEIINEMDEEEFITVFTEELFNKIHQMIKEKTLSWRNAILLLKQAGYRKELKSFFCYSFDDSSLSKRMPGMIIEEERRIEEKNERLLVDLCECYLLLCDKCIPDELLSNIVPCLLKVALNKEENEETQKEVEIALLALSHISKFCEIKQELYLNGITEIIKYHQEHHNLTQLSYQRAWNFLINRFSNDKSLEEVIVNELHFTREARRELEELMRCIDWKRKGERGKEVKEVKIIWRWLDAIYDYFYFCELWNEELVGLISCIVQVFRASRDNYPDISRDCIFTLKSAAEKRNVKIDVLLKEGTIVAFSEEMNQSTLDDDIMWNGLLFFLSISERLKEKEDEETDETKRKELKRRIFEKMEEEEFEDCIESFHKIFDFLNRKYYDGLSLNISDYFVNA